jgi:DNA-binding CsgD family transcriptional regulator
MDDSALGSAPGRHSQAASASAAADAGRNRAEDVNFSTIVGLDSAGGWHILRISPEGLIVADTAAFKVLRQFFPDEVNWAGSMPRAFAAAFWECREWGLGRALIRASKSLTFIKQGVKLTVQFIPNEDGGYIVLKIGRPVMSVDVSALPLTDREKEIAALVAAGKTNGEIGTVLSISTRTVQKHLENIFRKLGVETRMALAVRLSA